jgi:hypothetical protein
LGRSDFNDSVALSAVVNDLSYSVQKRLRALFAVLRWQNKDQQAPVRCKGLADLCFYGIRGRISCQPDYERCLSYLPQISLNDMLGTGR